MGSDSLPAEKNAAAIYSGLGLDVSPNSVSGSEGMSGEPQGYSPLESPTNILNVRVFLVLFRYSATVSFVLRGFIVLIIFL